MNIIISMIHSKSFTLLKNQIILEHKNSYKMGRFHWGKCWNPKRITIFFLFRLSSFSYYKPKKYQNLTQFSFRVQLRVELVLCFLLYNHEIFYRFFFVSSPTLIFLWCQSQIVVSKSYKTHSCTVFIDTEVFSNPILFFFSIKSKFSKNLLNNKQQTSKKLSSKQTYT